MTWEEPALSVRIECYAGYWGKESPRRFFLKNREIVVEQSLTVGWRRSSFFQGAQRLVGLTNIVGFATY
jgi:hypothetical protein